MGYRLGVDLGMTYTSAAVAVGGRAEVLGLGIRAMQVPSVVYLREDGEVLVGEAAEQRGAADPARLVREFKRRIGDPVPLVVGGAPHSAPALTARLLAWVVGVATERQGGPPEHVCVTHPADWGTFKIELLGQAIGMAGLGGIPTSTCSEPEAAAIAYASRDRVAVGERIAVYDLGGGTFDAAVLVREPGGFRLAGPPEGVAHLGGVDFDEAVFRHVLAALGDDLESRLDDSDPLTLAALARLRRDCVEAKEVLSSDVDTAVTAVLPGTTRSVRLTRGELDEMLRPAVGETVAAMQRTLESAGTAPRDLSAIVMVGGSSRIPLVSQMVSTAFERPLAMDVHPKHDVALGAALRGAFPAGAAAAGTDVVDPAGATAAVDPAATGPVRIAAARPSGPPPDRRPVRSGPPAGSPPTAPAARPRRRRPVPILIAATALAALAATVVIVDPPWAQLVHREAVDAPGAYPPFLPPNGAAGEVPAPAMENVAAVTGDTPGLYGGTRSNACDAGAIRAHLETDPAKALAWSSALGLEPAGIAALLASLTPVTLRTDTAVTNHGFEDGRPTPFQSVLQAGTAVLVDPRGLPRVRCYCGNPLAEPDQRAAVRYTDPAWADFSGEAVTVISPARAEVRDFVVVAPGTNEVVTRPRGTTGQQDRAADPEVVQQVEQTFVSDSAAGAATSPAPAPPGTPDATVPAPDAGGTATGETTTVAPDPGDAAVVGPGVEDDVVPGSDTAVPVPGPDEGATPDPGPTEPGPAPGPPDDSVQVEPITEAIPVDPAPVTETEGDTVTVDAGG